MKKWTALLLAIVLALSLTGCSLLKPELCGTYRTEVSLRDQVIKQFDSGTGLSGTDYSLEHYLTDFNITINYVFLQDKTYSITVDPSSIEAATDHLKTAVAQLLDDYVFAAVKQQYIDYGFPVETRDDVTELLDITWGELCTTVLDAPLEGYVDVMISSSFVEALTAEYHCEGRFKARKGQLHLSQYADVKPSKEIYETYEIDGRQVTFTGAVNLKENIYIEYPYILIAVD